MLLIVLLQILLMVSLRGQNKKLSLLCSVTLDKISKIKICHMVASKYPEVIEGGRRFIATDVLDYGETAEDGAIDNDGAALDE